MQVLTHCNQETQVDQELAKRMSVLGWSYRGIRDMLRRWRYGEAIPEGLAGLLITEWALSELGDGDTSRDIGIEFETMLGNEIAAERQIQDAEQRMISVMKELEAGIAELEAKRELTTRELIELQRRRREYREFISWPPENVPGYKCDPDPLQERLRRIYDRSVLEDWAQRYWHRRLHEARAMEPQPRRFVRLLHGEGTEKLRQIVNEGLFVLGRKFVLSRREFARKFSRIIAELPEADDAKVEHLARSLAALAAGYEPTTGYRKLAGMIVRCHGRGCERPAVVEVAVAKSRTLRPWCGKKECLLERSERVPHPRESGPPR